MDEIIKEKALDNYPLPVTIEATNIILNQLKKCVCKIKNIKGDGTGFFCYIPYNEKKLPVLITNYHVIDENFLKENKNIAVTLNDSEDKIIELDTDMQYYTSEKYDTTIIEIKKENNNDFLELDENMFKEQPILYNESIYILQYPKIGNEQKASIGYGIFKKIDGFNINHYCCTNEGSSGSPILRLTNNKIIGIHKGGSQKFNFNNGTFLKEPINEFINEIKKKINQPKIAEGINLVSNNDKFSFSRYKKAAKIGLKNLGDTSYFNAVLQFLGNNRVFAIYFLNPKNSEVLSTNIPNNLISFVFQRLFVHLYPYPEKVKNDIYTPNTFLSVLDTLNYFNNDKEKKNPNSLNRFILENLHKELNKAQYKYQCLVPNIYNKKDVIEYEIINYSYLYNSIIFNNFNWSEIKELKCPICNLITYGLNTFNTFDLDILGTIKNNKFNNNITLNECLNYYHLPKFEELWCECCSKDVSKEIISTIYSTSYNLIFSLDRGNINNIDLLNKIFVIEEKINLSNFIENKNSPMQFELFGIVSVMMENNKCQYISFCKSPVDNNWYLYNDENVQSIQLIDVIDMHNKGKYFPCLLGYKSI